MDWNRLLDMSPNPNALTVREPLVGALTPDEFVRFERHIQPLADSGRGIRRSAFAYLHARMAVPKMFSVIDRYPSMASHRAESVTTLPTHTQEEDLLSGRTPICDLLHERPRPAILRVEIKSNRATQPGRPMVRTVFVCASHARALRGIGIDLVS